MTMTGSALARREEPREHADALVDHLADRGLRAWVAPNASHPPGAVAVSAQRVDVEPFVGRLVLLLPGPRDADGLFWHWQRPYHGHPEIGARWLQPFRPASETAAAAETVAAVIDAEVRARARLAHTPSRADEKTLEEGVQESVDEAEVVRQVLIRMGRPLHLLAYRSVALLDSVERSVEDTVLLHELFKIDHLATRTLRGLERLAVLGGATAREVRQALPLATVMRQAVAQVEHYPRVQVQVPPPHLEAELPGSAGPELTLLLAELVENATKFSPPDTRVQIAAVPDPTGGVSIEVTDRGLPMSAEVRATLNTLLADPDSVSLCGKLVAGPIGLLVAAELARRHGVKVTLHPREPNGTRAVVTLPSTLLLTPRPAAPPTVETPAATTAPMLLPPALPPALTPALPPAITPGRDTVPGPRPATGQGESPAASAGRSALPRRRSRIPQGPRPPGTAGVSPAARPDPPPQSAAPPARQPGRGPDAGLLADFVGPADEPAPQGGTGRDGANAAGADPPAAPAPD